jgi:transcriptional regulator with XRE-family HTH domain
MPRSRGEIDTSTYTGRFAERLRMLREKKGLSVEEVAESLGVTQQTVYTWEDGSRVLPPQKFQEVALLYKLKKVKDLLPDE